MKSYNPFGREGAGAPLRDENGRIIAERLGFFSPSKILVGLQRDTFSPMIM